MDEVQRCLFENFCFNELIANDVYSLNKINFWRTTNQSEIDFIIQGENVLEAIAVKWDSKKIPKSFDTLHAHYNEIKTKVITLEDYL